MSIRTRLALIVILMGLVPTIIALFAVTVQIQRLADINQDALERVTIETIRGQAVAVADQIEQYLANHPEIDPADMSTLMTDRDLEILAVQPVIGDSGYTAVFNANAVTYFHPNPEIVGVDLETLGSDYPEFWRIISNSLGGVPAEGSYDWPEPDGTVKRKFMAIQPVADTPLRVAATAYYEEFTQPIQSMAGTMRQVAHLTRTRFTLFALTVAIAAVIVAVMTAARFTEPLREMTEAAGQVMEGKWDAIRFRPRFDEVGALNRALYDMTKRIQELVQRLEGEVAARTEELARRTNYLEITTEITNATTGVVDLPALFVQVVTSISRHFGHYHVGIFLLDSTGERALLKAASSEEGQRMLAEKYQVRVKHGDNAVGDAIASSTSRLILAQKSTPSIHLLPRLSQPSYQKAQYTEDSEVPVNPDMPETRAQLVLPMRSRGETVGALDIHSAEEKAFSDEEVIVLQALADQLAVALSNARLFQQAQESLEAERRAYGEASREAWNAMLATHPNLGFIRDRRGLFPVGDVWGDEMEVDLREGATIVDGDGANNLATPIKVRGQVIGVIDAYKSSDEGEWSPRQIALLETLADQLGQALESARLYQDTQRRAAQERLTSEVTGRMRETLDIETVLKTTVQEVRKALGLPEVVVRLAPGAMEETGNGVEDEGA